MFYYVYLLKSVNPPTVKYVGYTTNVKKPLEEHNSGGSIHTSKYGPWRLEACFAFRKESKAIEFEKYLKSSSGRAFAEKRVW